MQWGENYVVINQLINIVNTIIISPKSYVNNSFQNVPRYYVDMPIDLNEVMDLDHTIEKKGIYGHN